MKTVQERATALIATGLDMGAAYAQASQSYQSEIDAQHQAALNEITAKATAEADKAAGVRVWLDVRIAGMKDTAKKPGYGCSSLENVIAVHPATIGKDTQAEGNPLTLYPPQLWAFQKGQKPEYIKQSVARIWLAAADAMGADRFLDVLRSIGSDAAIKDWKDAKAKLTAEQKIVNRNKD